MLCSRESRDGISTGFYVHEISLFCRRSLTYARGLQSRKDHTRLPIEAMDSVSKKEHFDESSRCAP
jgi:hypothetical protein